MTQLRMAAGIAAALLLVSACDKHSDDNGAAPASGNAAEAAGDSTIADKLADNGKFAAAAKATGLDATLANPGPYTVLVPTDAAFDKLPAGALDTLMKPESREQLTAVLSYHILPGTMLAADVAKAIEAGKGKALVATMGGGTITATMEDGKIVLADSAGTRATVVGADEKRSNGVVQEIDAVLMPAK